MPAKDMAQQHLPGVLSHMPSFPMSIGGCSSRNSSFPPCLAPPGWPAAVGRPRRGAAAADGSMRGGCRGAARAGRHLLFLRPAGRARRARATLCRRVCAAATHAAAASAVPVSGMGNRGQLLLQTAVGLSGVRLSSTELEACLSKLRTHGTATQPRCFSASGCCPAHQQHANLPARPVQHGSVPAAEAYCDSFGHTLAFSAFVQSPPDAGAPAGARCAAWWRGRRAPTTRNCWPTRSCSCARCWTWGAYSWMACEPAGRALSRSSPGAPAGAAERREHTTPLAPRQQAAKPALQRSRKRRSRAALQGRSRAMAGRFITTGGAAGAAYFSTALLLASCNLHLTGVTA